MSDPGEPDDDREQPASDSGGPADDTGTSGDDNGELADDTGTPGADNGGQPGHGTTASGDTNRSASADAGRTEPAGNDSPGWLRVYAPRVGTMLVVAVVVAVVLGAIPSLLAAPSGGTSTTETRELNLSEYDTDEIVATERPAEGGVRLSTTGSGTVVIDADHANDLTDAQLQPMREAFRRAGYSVELHEGGDLSETLSDAVGFVVVDPGTDFEEEDRSAVRSFTADGGRLLVFAEPTTVEVDSGFRSTSVVEERSEVAALTLPYNLSVRTSYVYNTRRNDGNFKNPLARPAGPASADGVEGPVALYTPARVVSLDDDTEPLLRAAAGSQSSGRDQVGQFALAARSGNAVVVGDSTVLDTDRFNVANNEAFLTYLFEFLVSSPRATQTPTPTATPTQTPTPTATSNETATQTATSNETATQTTTGG